MLRRPLRNRSCPNGKLRGRRLRGKRSRLQRQYPRIGKLDRFFLSRAAARVVAWFRGVDQLASCGCRVTATASVAVARRGRLEPLEDRRVLAIVFIDDIEVPLGTPSVDVPIFIQQQTLSEEISQMGIAFAAGDMSSSILIPSTGMEFSGSIFDDPNFFTDPGTPGVHFVFGGADGGTSVSVPADGLLVTYRLDTASLAGGTYNLDPNFSNGTFAQNSSGQSPQLSFSPGILTINAPPTADADGPYTIFEREDLTLDASFSTDPEQDIVEYAWDLDNDGDFVDHMTSNAISTVAWAELDALSLPRDAELSIQLRVTDQAQQTSFDSTALTIFTSEPVPVVVVTPSSSVGCNVPQTFDASNSFHTNPNLGITQYEWDFDYDGITFVQDAIGVSVTHTYDIGTHMTALRVTDNDSVDPQQRIGTVVTDVTFTNDAPNANAGGPYTSQIIGGSPAPITLDGTGSADPNSPCDNIVSFEWDIDNDGLFGADDVGGVGGNSAEQEPTGNLVSNYVYPLWQPGVGTATIGLRVTDTFGGQGTGVATITFQPPPTPPTADAGGPYNTGPDDPVTFDGSASFDPDTSFNDFITRVEWDVDDDGTFDFVVDRDPGILDPSDFRLELTAQQIDTFGLDQMGAPNPITLRVTDTVGLMGLDTTTLTIAPPPMPPVADADGPYVVETGQGVTLDGSASFDPNACCGDSIVQYAWDLDNDGLFGESQGGQTEPVSPNATVNVSSAVLNAFNLNQTGTPFTIRLRVMDSGGLTGQDSTTLTIFNNQPTASFTANPNPAACNQTVTFDASNSSHSFPDRSIVAWEWDFDDDGQFDDATGETVQFTFPAFGSFNVALRVTDDNEPARTDAAESIVDVNLGNRSPQADPGGPYVIDFGSGLLLDASLSSDPDVACGDSVVEYEWDLDDDGAFDLFSPTPTLQVPPSLLSNLSVADPQTGLPTNTVTLRVTDELGLSTTGATSLTIFDNRPFAAIDTFPAPPDVMVNEQILFSGAGSTHGHPDRQIVSFFWDFDASDGVDLDPNSPGFFPDAAGQSVPIQFPTAGSFTVTLQVVDDNPTPRQDSTTVVVTVTGQAPVLDAGGPYTVVEGNDVTLAGACIPATSPECAGSTFHWDFDGDGNTDATGLSPTFSAANFDGPETVTAVLTALDQSGNPVQGFEDTAVINIQNGPPFFTSTPLTNASAAHPYSYQATADDPGGAFDPLTFSPIVTPAGMTVDPVTGLVEWTPPSAGNFNVSIQVSDGDGGTANQNWILRVVPGADAGGPYNVDEGSSITLAGNCDGCSQFRWDLDGNGTFETVGPNPVYSAAALDGPDQQTIGLEACNATGNLCSEATTIVTVNNVAPVITTSPPTTGAANQTYVYQPAASDPAGSLDPLQWQLIAAPSGMTVNATTGRINWTPTSSGAAGVTLMVSDGDGGEATQSWNITVPGSVSAGGPYLVNEGGSVQLAADCVDCTSFRWDLDNNGSFETTGPTPVFSAAGLDGPSQQTVRLEGCISGACSESTAQIDVRNVAPTITSTPITAATTGQVYTYLPAATDPAGVRDPLTWSLVSAPAGMAVNTTTGLIEWTPAAAGIQSVTLRVADGDGGVDEQVWNIAIIAQGTLVQEAFVFYNNSAFDTERADIVTVAGAAGGGHVKVFDGLSSTSELASFLSYPNFTGGVRVATGDVNGDGVQDVITAAGAGTPGNAVKVFDGATGRLLDTLFAFPGNTAGVTVAVGNVNGDDFDDIIVGAAPGSPGGHVKVFNGRDFSELHNIFFFAPATGTVNVAAGDVNGDGRDDIIVGAGPGGGPHVKVFDGATTNLLSSFFAYDASFSGGVFVAAGDVNGDGFDDIVTGAGAGGGPHVRVFDGTSLTELHNFFAYDATFTGGVRVAAGDVSGDGVADIITGAGPGGGPHVKVFDGESRAELSSFFAYGPGFTGGVFVAAADFEVATVSADDLRAIDPTKEALRLGETATIRNVTSNPRGLNGIGFHVLNLPAGGAGISLADFRFRVGNDNSPDGWAAGPAPSGHVVLPDATPDGASSILFTFNDGSVVDTWLEVTIFGNANTGLVADERFYFGNAVGETGAAFSGLGQFFGRDGADSSSIVGSGLNRPAGVGDRHDIDVNGTVNIGDVQAISTAGIRPNVILAITPQAGGPPVAVFAAPSAPLPVGGTPMAGSSMKDRVFADFGGKRTVPYRRESFVPLESPTRSKAIASDLADELAKRSQGEDGWTPELRDLILERAQFADFHLRSVAR